MNTILLNNLYILIIEVLIFLTHNTIIIVIHLAETLVNNKVSKKIKKIIEELALFDDWEEKYLYIIELGIRLPKLKPNQKIETNKVSGCISQVWLTHKITNNTFYFYGDSDAIIVKGLLSIVISLYSKKTRKEIQAIDFIDIFQKMDLKNNLTPSRSNGLFSVINKIRSL